MTKEYASRDNAYVKKDLQEMIAREWDNKMLMKNSNK